MPANELSSQEHLAEAVIGRGLCSGCTACVGLCPYWRTHRTRTVRLFPCDLEKGRCQRYCPRTATYWSGIQQQLFHDRPPLDPIGPSRGLYLTRAADPEIRDRAQHGGTVSALACVALENGWLDAWVMAGAQTNGLSAAVLASDRDTVLGAAGSKFVMSPAVAEFNRASSDTEHDLGVVATPCQALALAKMRTNPDDTDRARLKRLKLVIGLFCGWALDWEKLRGLLTRTLGRTETRRLDIPPSRYACMEVTTPLGTQEIPIAEVTPCVRDACWYCYDMTAEFADLSVGAARSEDGWEVDRGWNQVIVRSDMGQKLLDLARTRSALEFKHVPEANLAKLKAASLKKKRACLTKLRQAAWPEAVIYGYLNADDPAVRLAE